MAVKFIVIHCLETPTGRDDRAADVHRWHIERGFDGIGYHYVIPVSGRTERGRPEYWTGAHVRGHNFESIGIALAGTDEFNDAQIDDLVDLLYRLKLQHQDAQIVGHYELDSDKTCPNFDVRKFVKRHLPGVDND